MGKQDVIEIDGIVEETLPNANFKVKLSNGHEIRAHVAGKIRMHIIRILPGDKEAVESDLNYTWAVPTDNFTEST